MFWNTKTVYDWPPVPWRGSILDWLRLRPLLLPGRTSHNSNHWHWSASKSHFSAFFALVRNVLIGTPIQPAFAFDKKTEHFWRDMEGKKSQFCRLEFKLHRQIILLNFVRFKLRICTVLCYLDLIWYNISDSNGHYHFIELVTKLDCSLMEKDRGGWGNSLSPHPGNSWVAKGTSGRDTEGAERRKLKECPFVIISQCFVQQLHFLQN